MGDAPPPSGGISGGIFWPLAPVAPNAPEAHSEPPRPASTGVGHSVHSH